MARRSLRQAKPGPGKGDDADQGEDVDRGPPTADEAQNLPEGRGNHGDEDERGHDERHYARHLATFIKITYDGDHDHARGGAAQSLQETGGQQPAERLRGARESGADREKDEAGEKDGQAAGPVGDPSGDELAYAIKMDPVQFRTGLKVQPVVAGVIAHRLREHLPPPGFGTEYDRGHAARALGRLGAVVAWAFVAHTDSRFDPDMLRRFVVAYQRVQPLTIGELWAVAISLRVVLVELRLYLGC